MQYALASVVPDDPQVRGHDCRRIGQQSVEPLELKVPVVGVKHGQEKFAAHLCRGVNSKYLIHLGGPSDFAGRYLVFPTAEMSEFLDRVWIGGEPQEPLGEAS